MSTADSNRKLGCKQIELTRHHLDEVVASHAFAGSKRAQEFLKLIVERTLAGQFDFLRERMIGAEMFGRPVTYDTGNDSVVRVKATEVRKKLAQYYLETEGKPAVRIELPTGCYVPKFHFEQPEATTPSQTKIVSLTSEKQTTTQHEDPSYERTEARVNEAPRLPSSKWLHTRHVLVGAVVGLTLIAVIGYLSFKKWHSDSNARAEIRSIAILPIENLSGVPAQEYFVDGMTEELINELGQVSTLRVISDTSAMSYKGTKKSLPEIARELDVDGIVEGGILREGNEVRISVQLIDARTDRITWSHTYVQNLTSLLTLQEEVAYAIADEVRINENSPPQAHGARMRLVNTEAHDLYLQGRSHLNAGDFERAVDYFEEAVDVDPNSAQAHAALAAAYGFMGESGRLAYKGAFLRQMAEAARAIELDDSLPEGHEELANAEMDLNWDWVKAESEFQKAEHLNPSGASVKERYAAYLGRIGKMPEAITEAKRDVELDPVSGLAYRNLGFLYYFSRQYDQALSEIQRAQALNVDLGDYFFLLGDIYAEKGMYRESISEFLKLGSRPHVLGHLGNAYARAGRLDAARKTISQLEEHVRKDGVGRCEIALVYAGLGKKDEAFNWLEEAYKAHDQGLTYLKIDPCLDPLRSYPRFDDLVRRVGLKS